MNRLRVAVLSSSIVATGCFTDPPPVEPSEETGDASGEGTDEGTSADSSEEMLDVSGMWSGDAMCQGNQTEFSMELVQVGSTVTGSADLLVFLGLLSGTVEATLDGNTLEGEVTSGAAVTPFDAEVEDDQMIGNVYVEAEHCPDVIRFTAVREP